MSLHGPLTKYWSCLRYRLNTNPPNHPFTQSLPLPASLTLFFIRSLFLCGHGEFSVYTALTCTEGDDYYSVAIKSQFEAERLCGHLKGHSTRQIIGPIEMDGAVEVLGLLAFYGWAPLPCRSLGLPTNWNHCPLRNIDASLDVGLWCFKWQQWIGGMHTGIQSVSEPGLQPLRGPRESQVARLQFIWAQRGENNLTQLHCTNRSSFLDDFVFVKMTKFPAAAQQGSFFLLFLFFIFACFQVFGFYLTLVFCHHFV